MPDNHGYYGQPCIHNDTIVFVSDDDLWQVSTSGGLAKRLTAGPGIESLPKISPDGTKIAFISTDKGHRSLYMMPIDGGAPTHLVYFSILNVIGWKDDNTILFSSSIDQRAISEIFAYDLREKSFFKVGFGEASRIAYSKGGAMMLARHTRDSARWKRYKGGTAGVLWTRQNSKEKFRRILKNIKTNIASPLLIENEIYFISDHEGSANIYRCTIDGKSVRRLTHHEDYYVRNMNSDGRRLVYQMGAEIYTYDLKTQKEEAISIVCPTPAVQTHPRFESAAQYLEFFAVSNNLQELSVVSRGHGYSMPVFAGPVTEWDLKKDIRYRFPTYSFDSKSLYFAGTSSEREDYLVRCNLEDRSVKYLFAKKDWGVIWNLGHNPKKSLLALATNRSELYLVDPETEKATLIERNPNGQIREFDWSPDGRYLAYSAPADDSKRTEIRVYDTKTKKKRTLIDSVLSDQSPVFSLDGRYLYFLSVREFYPVYNATHFDLGFPFGLKPYLVSLTADAPNPFRASTDNHKWEPPKEEVKDTKKKKTPKEKPQELEIDFEGIDHRILAFPVNLKEYASLQAIPGGVLYLTRNIEPLTDDSGWRTSIPYDMCVFKFEENHEDFWHANVKAVGTVQNGQYTLFSSKGRIRLIPSTSKPNNESDVGRKSGWIDLDRVRVEVFPKEEWRQMYREAWYLQKEHFWRADMSKVNWNQTYQRYLPLLNRVKTRSEFSDLIWEMQGDLGTSHCYEMGGQYLRVPRARPLGLLGADFEFNKKTKSYKISRIYRGDSWHEGHDSPLSAPGVSLQEGDEIYKINGQAFEQAVDIYSRLQNQNGVLIELTVKRRGEKALKRVTVKTLSEQHTLIYRDWVEKNRAKVHELSKGRLGYVHIPDMGTWGYSEFYRYFLTEVQYDGLVIDVRFNGGGHVSQHILKILAQKPLGVDESRYSGTMIYPTYAVRGPIVAITNETAGSDGDIFSHSFKLMKLGKLIGKRTWGGVIGINSQYSLRDRATVTQPEYSFWFNDVGWGVENYGTEPDIEVEITPEDYQNEKDPQLERAVEEALKDLEKKPAFAPKITDYPNLAQPKLGKS